MAFVCTLKEPLPTPRYREDDTTEVMALTHVGYDDREDVNYELMTGLSPNPVGQEYVFCLIRVDGEANTEDPIFGSSEVASIVPSHSRRIIKAQLLHQTAILLSAHRPDSFSMTTRYAHLPCPAMEKFHHLCHLFTACGYIVSRSNSYHGRHMWWMTLPSGPPKVIVAGDHLG